MSAQKCLLLTVVLVITVTTTCWGDLVIAGFQGNGELSVTGLWTNASCRVEWASSLTGRWYRSWERLDKVLTRTNTTMEFRVPMFYRVVMSLSEGMVVVPGGMFTMGSDVDGDADPDHQVTLSSFYLAEHETTYGLWYDVKTWATNNGYSFANAGREGHNGTIGAVPTAASNEPVTTVSWRDAIVWCNARSEKEGLTPVHTYGSTITNSSDGTACDNAVFSASANGYRLPTEAEWEYASRYQDGTSWTPGNYASGATNDYTDAAACDAVAWYADNSGDASHPVGEKDPNELVIYDMSGNVREWCWDWYENTYVNWSLTDPTGPVSGSLRVLRGGSWDYSTYILRCANRGNSVPDSVFNIVGFRCARGL